MSGFTPGPWLLGYVAPDGHGGVKHWLILEPHSPTIDSENRIASVSLRPEAEANAYVIAAAPELLAALRIAREELYEHMHATMSEAEFLGDSTIRAVDAAIRKAEGR